MAFIKVENLCFSYNMSESEEYARGKNIINDVSFEIEKGSFVCVLGHNGSGKSTLAKLLNMILTPVSGKIYIDGKDITSADMSDNDVLEIRKKIGMVFQDPDDQLVTTVVEEDVAFGPENLGLPREEIRKRVDNALETVKMTEFAGHATHQLSGGQKQRIAIAGVIAMQPECIIFDESTAMLDPTGRKAVMDTVEYLNREKGITVIHITHNMDEAVKADRVIVINDGSVYLDGTPNEVFSEVRKLRSVGLDVPQVTELFYDLSSEGINLPCGIIDMSEGVSLLSGVMKNG